MTARARSASCARGRRTSPRRCPNRPRVAGRRRMRAPSRARSARRLERARSASVRHFVDRHGQGEHKRLVLSCGDLDAIRVTHAEPLLRDLRDHVVVTLDLVLVVDDVSLRLEILAALDLDVEAVPDTHERLVDRGDGAVATLDGHLVADRELLLLDLRDLVAVSVLEDERVAQAHRLAGDLVDPLAVVILN